MIINYIAKRTIAGNNSPRPGQLFAQLLVSGFLPVRLPVFRESSALVLLAGASFHLLLFAVFVWNDKLVIQIILIYLFMMYI